MRISYVQRCYYQPVTEYVRKTYYEPVTRNYTSYYYEPVTQYRYSTYYDPCTGCPQKVCTPVHLVPASVAVQFGDQLRRALRDGAGDYTSAGDVSAAGGQLLLPAATHQQFLATFRRSPTPARHEWMNFAANPPSVAPGGSDTIVPQQLPTGPGTSYPRPGTNTKLRPDKTASRTSAVTVRGEVVLADQLTPRPNAKLVFMNADRPEQKEYVTANAYGEFDVRLPAGNWYLYLGGDNGRATYHKKLSLGDHDTVDYKVVSR